MHIFRSTGLFLGILAAGVFAVPVLAQQDSGTPAPSTDQAAPAPAPAPKKQHKPKPKPLAAPNAAAPGAPAATGTAAPAAAVAGGAKPTLLGQYGEWGAYSAAPGGKKVCFAIARPSSSETNPQAKSRNPPYMFISSRPADKVSNEVSIVIGYPFKPNTEATAVVGSASFALYTQQDGAWIKNVSEEARLIDALRSGQSAVVKGVSVKGTQSTDTFSLKGFSQALDRTDQECK
jgi:Invasion associated locus B (IalB) protein